MCMLCIFLAVERNENIDIEFSVLGIIGKPNNLEVFERKSSKEHKQDNQNKLSKELYIIFN